MSVHRAASIVAAVLTIAALTWAAFGVLLPWPVFVVLGVACMVMALTFPEDWEGL